MTADLTVIRPAARAVLEKRLAAAVATDPALQRASDAILLPVRTLAALAQLAVPALGDDPAAAERLLLLTAAAAIPFEIDDTLAREAAASAVKATTGVESNSVAPAWPNDGLLDLGGVVILGLASLRAGAPTHQGSQLLGTLSGLVLATGPAEAVLRWARLSGADHGFETFLASFAAAGDGRTGLYRVFARQLLMDPFERARWGCILAVFGGDGLASDAKRSDGWYAAHADGVERITAIGDQVTLEGRFPPRDSSGDTGTASTSTTTTGAATDEELQVVVAGRRGVSPERALATVGTWTEPRIVASVLGGLAGGWAGFTSVALVRRANALRDILRKRWGVIRSRCLPDGVPVDLITDLPYPPMPPQVITRSEPMLVEALVMADGQPVDAPRIAASRALVIAVQTTFADAPAWVFLMDDPAPRTPVVAGHADIPVPAAWIGTRTNVTVALSATPTGAADDQRTVALPGLARPLRVILALPTVIDATGSGRALTLERADAVLDAAARRQGVALVRQILPTADDDLAVVYGPITGADDSRVDRLLGALGRTATGTPGGEDALWLAVVPEGNDSENDGEPPVLGIAAAPAMSWQRQAPWASAAAVAVTTPSQVEAVLANLLDHPPVALSPRAVLRLIGRITGTGGIAWTSQRSETRAWRPALGSARTLMAITLDDDGRVLDRHAMPSITTRTADQIDVLIPIAPETATVAILAQDDIIAQVVKPLAGPDPGTAMLRGDDLTWAVDHPRGLPMTLTLEARLAPARALGLATDTTTATTWTMLESWCSCCANRHTPAWHHYLLSSATPLRVVADDGWHAVIMPLGVAPGVDTAAVVRIRHLPDGRLWADGPGQPNWNVGGPDGPARVRSRLLQPVAGTTIALNMRVAGTTIRDRPSALLAATLKLNGTSTRGTDRS